MKTTKTNEKTYVSPSVRIVEVEENAVICTSGPTGETDPWEEE